MNYLIPQRAGHLVDDGAEFSVFPGVPDVGPGAEGDQRQTQDHVTQAGNDVHAHKARDARSHVHDKDDHEQGGRRAGGVENVLGVIVLDVLDKHLVDFSLQLLQVAPAELLASHLLHAPEHLQGLLSDDAVSGLQLARGQEGPVTPADLGSDWRGSVKKDQTAGGQFNPVFTYPLHFLVVQILRGCDCCQIIRLCCGLREKSFIKDRMEFIDVSQQEKNKRLDKKRTCSMDFGCGSSSP